jgi:hypothetical protein
MESAFKYSACAGASLPRGGGAPGNASPTGRKLGLRTGIKRHAKTDGGFFFL